MAVPATVKQLPWDEQSCALMQDSADASPWALVSGFHDALGSAHLWQIEQGGSLSLLAVRGTQREHGRLLEVVGLRSIGERIHAAAFGAVMDQIAREAYQADLLSMCTRRPHLVRACERAGWSNVASVAIKPLRLQ